MLREASAAQRYLAGGKASFYDLRTPEFRDAAELRALQFTETGTKVGRSFRRANPLIPWEDLDQLRNDLAHEYPEVKADKVWKLIHDDLPVIMGRLEHARYPGEDN